MVVAEYDCAFTDLFVWFIRILCRVESFAQYVARPENNKSCVVAQRARARACVCLCMRARARVCVVAPVLALV